MQTILVANPKGGSGKTTVATNIAGWLAGKRQRVALADHDPQRSASEWLARRPALFPAIIGVPFDAKKNALKEAAPQWQVVDTPAGLHGGDLREALNSADVMLVPLAPSAFDMAATAHFLAAAAEYTGFTELDANRRHVMDISHRRRGADASAELIVDVLYPDDSRVEAITAGFERMLGSARIPELRSVHVKLRAQTVDLVSEVLRRCGRSASSDLSRSLIFVADGAALNCVSDGSGSPKASARAALTGIVDVIAPQIAR